jgi:hypothetical protein
VERRHPDRRRPAARRGRLGAHAPALPQDLSDLVVVEVARRGKLVVGEPFFAPGTPLLLERKGLGDVGAGDLAVVRRGRGRARIEHALGRANDVEAVLEGLLVSQGARTAFEHHELPAPMLD